MRSRCPVPLPLRLGAEALGTALLVLGALTAIAARVGDPLTGVLVGVVVALIAASPLGPLSGAHLNPAVTLAFLLRGTIAARDAAGYVVAQALGALGGAALAGTPPGGVTHPAVPLPAAFALEAAMTAVLVGVIVAFVARPRLERWTPLAVLVVLAALIWAGGRLTGTSLNPVRSAGPALVAGDLADLWLYLAAPLAGAVAVGVTRGRGAWTQPRIQRPRRIHA